MVLAYEMEQDLFEPIKRYFTELGYICAYGVRRFAESFEGGITYG